MAQVETLYLDLKAIRGKVSSAHSKLPSPYGSTSHQNGKLNLKQYINSTTSELEGDFTSTNETHSLKNVGRYNDFITTNFVGMNYIDSADNNRFSVIGISKFNNIPFLGLPTQDTPLIIDTDFTNGKYSMISVFYNDGIVLQHSSSSNLTSVKIEDDQLELKRVIAGSLSQEITLDASGIDLTSYDLAGGSDNATILITPTEIRLETDSSSGTIRIDNTGIGFFGAAPVAQQAKADNNNWAAISDVTNALANLGLIDAA